jgi:hypothetical protein
MNRRMKTRANTPCRSIAYEQSPRQLSAYTATAKTNSNHLRKHNPPHTATPRECHRNTLAKEDGQNNEIRASKHVLTKRNVVEVGQELECLDVGLLRALAHPLQLLAKPTKPAILAPAYQFISTSRGQPRDG